MADFLITFAVLVFMLVLIRAILRRSRLALGMLAGVVLALPALSMRESLVTAQSIPIWLPPLPFALIALTLFAFGLLAWYWSED
jgi:xanthine/uracil permease